MKLGKKRFRQYSLKSSVRIWRAKIKVQAWETFFSVKIPTAMACISTSENIIEVCTIGQNFPALSYLGAYTLINCEKNAFSSDQIYIQNRQTIRKRRIKNWPDFGIWCIQNSSRSRGKGESGELGKSRWSRGAQRRESSEGPCGNRYTGLLRVHHHLRSRWMVS